MEIFQDSVLDDLKKGRVKPGETILCGWFWFQVIDLDGQTAIECLDFKEMASFTTNLNIVQIIHTVQQERLARYRAREENCNMLQAAFVSKSFTPGGPSVFLERQSKANERDSGWYVGLTDDPLDMEDEDSFEWKSLYELTILDERLASWWLFPVGTSVFFDESDGYAKAVEQVGYGKPDPASS